jgi:hypothetical protein
LIYILLFLIFFKILKMDIDNITFYKLEDDTEFSIPFRDDGKTTIEFNSIKN